LELGQVDLVHEGASVGAEDWTRLLVEAAHNDGLLHAFESHTKEEESRDLKVTGEVYENLAQSCDLGFLLGVSLGKGWWDSQGSSLLEVLDGIANISIFWRLDSSSKDFLGFIFIPEFDLEYKLF